MDCPSNPSHLTSEIKCCFLVVTQTVINLFIDSRGLVLEITVSDELNVCTSGCLSHKLKHNFSQTKPFRFSLLRTWCLRQASCDEIME